MTERERQWQEEKRRLQEDQKEREETRKRRKQGEPAREQLVFSAINRAGLSHLIPELMSISGEGLPYWKTGLFLMHSYLTDKKNYKKYVKALTLLVNKKEIAPSSKGFLLYLAGKIEKSQGNWESSMQYLERCKKETPLMYEHLMSQDPAYDLEATRQVLLKQRGK